MGDGSVDLDQRLHTAGHLLDELGAVDIDHPGGRLGPHLARTAEQLRAWGAPDELCLAGRTHAAYGTDGFPLALLRPDERDRLRACIGGEAEAIVWRYCACDRSATYARLGESPLRLTDRRTGEVIELEAEEAEQFAALTIANELDIVRVGQVPAATVDEIRRLFVALGTYAPDLAAAAVGEIDSWRAEAGVG